jgi:hypothetical protein
MPVDIVIDDDEDEEVQHGSEMLEDSCVGEGLRSIHVTMEISRWAR